MKKVQSGDVLHELVLTASRSGGPGGQHVNKVSSKITLKWDVKNAQVLNEEQRKLLLKKLVNRLTTEGVLVLTAQEGRSQVKNKEVALKKLDQLLAAAFKPKKLRKATKPTKASIQRRIEQKKQRAEKKQWRKKL